MLIIAGTVPVPVPAMPLTTGVVRWDGGMLAIGEHRLQPTQGTGAMISAALATTEYLKIEPPQVVVAGDRGRGGGSRDLYEYLTANIGGLAPSVLALHYCLPDISLTRRLCDAAARCRERPVMVADAASMYAAKASGLAREFDVFTPDASEIAFLADPDATHPAYIARHLFDTDSANVPELVAAAYGQGAASRVLLVKGAVDYVVRSGEIVETIREPDVPVLEAIGGTGDTITGMVAAFLHAGLEPHEAAILAARANRVAGQYARPTPATPVAKIVEQLPTVFSEHLCRWSGACLIDGGQQ